MRTQEKTGIRDKLRRRYRKVDCWFVLVLLSVFQFFSSLPVVFSDGQIYFKQWAMFIAFNIFEWVYVLFMRAVLKKVNFELELIAFFLCGVGMTVITSIDKGLLKTQLIATILGVIVYDILLWFLQDVKRVMAVRLPLAIFTIGFFGAAFLYIYLSGSVTNGAYNWIKFGGFSVQPSEFVKIAFVFVGAASLDKLLTMKNSYAYIGFALYCIGVPVLMRDLGTALIFFFTFMIIAFMRSGDVRTLAFICAVALVGALIVIMLKPYVANRFAAWGHVWENIDNSKGYQQVRTLVYCASGGLFGLGVGRGNLRYVFASENDLVFGVVCEELGMIIAFSIVICFAVIAIYAVVNSRSAPSTFYSIAACGAAAMLLFQTSLNIFGITDLLPLTGVTLPFVSQGGSSMICSWALFAFIKSADVRAYPKVFKNQ